MRTEHLSLLTSFIILEGNCQIMFEIVTNVKILLQLSIAWILINSIPNQTSKLQFSKFFMKYICSELHGDVIPERCLLTLHSFTRFSPVNIKS